MNQDHAYGVTGRLSPTARAVAWALRRLRRVRKPAGLQDWIGAALVAAVVVGILVQALGWLLQTMLSTWWLLPALVTAGGGGVWGRARARVMRARAAARRLQQLRYSMSDIDQMSPAEFELAVRDLMIRDGISARQVGGSNDQAADVIGRHPPTGQTIVVQCKHTTTAANVGVNVVYQVNGTAGPAHQADIAVIVTNGGFTVHASRNAADFRIALIDRAQLAHWADQGADLVDILALGRFRGHRHRLRHRHSTSG